MTPAPDAPMVEVHALSLSLGRRLVLDDVAFTVRRGESVGLVGPNGSGKTSLLRCLLGLVPFRGRALVDGHDVVLDPIGARTKMTWLPQKPSFGDATAWEALAFVARLRRIDLARIPAMLERVGLGSHAHERARTFSGGMQQRLSLGLALLVDAPLLLLDEPTASLDREGQTRFLEEVERLRADGRTLLLASHRPEEVARLTDRVLHLSEGKIVSPPGGIRGRGVSVLPLFEGRPS